MRAFIGILIFSTIESATVAIWGTVLLKAVGLILSAVLTAKLGVEVNINLDFPFRTDALLFTILDVGYILEHSVAHNNAKGRPLLNFPRP
jgi:hypothetical protein